MRIKSKKGIAIFLIVVMAMVGMFVPGGEEKAYADFARPKNIKMFYVVVPNQGIAYGTIDEENKKIVVDVPNGTDVTKLDSSVYIDYGLQIMSRDSYYLKARNSEVYDRDAFLGPGLFYKLGEAAFNVDIGILLNTDGLIDLFKDVKDADTLKKLFPTVFENIIEPRRMGPQDFTHPVNLVVVSSLDDYSTYEVTVRVSESRSQEKSITAFGFEGLNMNTEVTSIIDEANKVITLKVPDDTNVKALVPTFTITGASLMTDAESYVEWTAPGGRIINVPIKVPVKQASETTAQDFTNPVQYVVTADDLSTSTYTVSVIRGDEAKKITSFRFAGLNPAVNGVVDEENHLVKLEVPEGTNVKALVPTFTITGTSVTAVELSSRRVVTPVSSGTTAFDFTYPVIFGVYATDHSVTTYTATVKVVATPAKAITSFKFEGLNPVVSGVVDEVNHRIALTVPNGTDISALVPTFTTTGVSTKVANQPQVSGTTAQDFTNLVSYVVESSDDSSVNYDVKVTIATVQEKAITAFHFEGLNPGLTGTVDGANKTIALTVPFGTNVKALTPTFAIAGNRVTIGNTAQVSGTTTQDFTNPVTYTVVAADDSSENYTVTVKVAAPGVIVNDKEKQLPPVDNSIVVNLRDISGHWAETTIKQEVKQGIVKGYEDGSFKPDAIITRAEFVTMLMNALKPALSNTPLSFTDLLEIPAWSKQAITQAVEGGILSGYPDGSFRPQANITRMEMAMMIAKASGTKIATDVDTGFSDDNEIALWAKGAVLTAKQLGIVNGRGDNLFVPNGIATRAEAVTMIMNLLQVK